MNVGSIYYSVQYLITCVVGQGLRKSISVHENRSRSMEVVQDKRKSTRVNENMSKSTKVGQGQQM